MSVNPRNNNVTLGGSPGFDVLTSVQPVPLLTGNTTNRGTIFKATDGSAYAVDSNGDSLKLAPSPVPLVPELVPVRDFRTSAQIAALAAAAVKPNDGTSFIVSDGTRRGDIATWDEATQAFIYFTPSDLDVTTVTNPDNEVNQGKWRYDVVGDYWVQITTGIIIPEVDERPVSATNIVFGRKSNIISMGVAPGRTYAFIQNDAVAIWGNGTAFTNGPFNSAEDSQPRKISWNWYDGNTVYSPTGQYAPKFTDVVHNDFTMLALDQYGKIWCTGTRVEGMGMTTTPTGTAGVPFAPAMGLTPVPFWQAQLNVFVAKIFMNHPKYDRDRTISGALTTDGDLYLAGTNIDGQLGQGNFNITRNWVKYPIGNVVNVKISDTAVFVLTADNKLYCTGYYDQASTLIPSPFQQNTPRLMISDVADFDFAMDAGGNDARSLLVVKTDGTVWGVGSNAVGQLGIGNTTAQNAFRQAVGVQNAKAVFCSKFAGNSTTGIIRTDGTVSFCGQNTGGCMGFTVATATASYSTFITPAFAAQGTIVEGMIGQVTTLRTASGSIWNAGPGNQRGLGFSDTSWANSNRFQQVPLPEAVLAMRGSVSTSAGSFNDNTILLTGNGIIVYGGAFPADLYAGRSVQFIFSPYALSMLQYLNNGIDTTAPLGAKYDKAATITAITAGSIADIYDEISNQFTVITLTTDGTAGKLDTTGATLTGANLTAANQTNYVYHVGDTGNTIRLVFRINATDALASGASATQSYVLTLGGITFNLIGNRIDDVIRKSLSTNLGAYNSATALDPVIITEAEYNTLAALSGATKAANNDATFNAGTSIGAINSTSFLTSGTNANNTISPAFGSGFPYAFKFKASNGDSLSFSSLHLGFATSTTAVGTQLMNNFTFPAGTVADATGVVYVVIKSANTQTPANSLARIKYPKNFVTSPAGANAGNFLQPAANATVGTPSNLGSSVFTFQVLSLPTKQWL
jgi:hypothetical protein